jgi:hypothetical protein
MQQNNDYRNLEYIFKNDIFKILKENNILLPFIKWNL